MIAGIFIFVYFTVEKPIVEESVKEQFNNFSLAAYDSSGKLVKTGYAIVLDNSGTVFKRSFTDDKSYVHENVPLNHTIKIFNENLAGQHYYTDSFDYDYLTSGVTENTRVNLNLKDVGNLSFNVLGNLSTGSITIIVTSIGEVKDIMFCVRWSEHIITVQNEQYSIVDVIPQRLKNRVDKCFNTKTTLKDSTLIVFLKFDKFGSLSPNDKIDVIFVDKDNSLLSNGLVLSAEDSQGADIGLNDVSITII